MAAPTNISSGTAIELGPFPNSITQNVNDSGTTYTVWYKYTALPSDFEKGLWAFGDLTTYLPAVTVYDTDATTVILGLADVVNVPIQFPTANGHTYYFKIVSSTGNVAAASLTIDGQNGPSAGVAAGSLLVNDDTIGFPGIVLASTGPTVLRAVNVVSGEFGDSLLSGVFALNDQSAVGTLKIYSPTFAVVATVTIPGTPGIVGIRSNRVDTFYVGTDENPPKIYSVASDGTIGGTIWTLPSAGNPLWTFAPTRDDSTLYYVPYDGNATHSIVYKYNLNTSTDEGSFLAAQSPYFVTQDLLILSDNTLLVGYKKSIPLDFKVEHVSAAGTVLATYDRGALFSFATLDYRLCLTTDDLTTFWSKTFATDTKVGTYSQIRVSDGAVLETYDINTFEVGVFAPPPTATPTRFGPSASCALISLAQQTGTGTIIVTKTTPGLSGITAVFPFSASGGLTPTSFSLTSGTTQTFTPVAGSGYAISETAPSGWTATYTVNNGSSVNNLTIAEGETVTVDVANTVTHTTRTDPVRRLRQTAHLSDEQVWLFFSKFQLDCETGVGLNNGQGVDPQVMLSWSDDGGHTWSPERWVSAGKQGEYRRRVIWRRLGRSRDRVWRIVVSDPVAWRLLAAYVDVVKGTS